MIKKAKPTSPGRRGSTFLKYGVSLEKPKKNIIKRLSKGLGGAFARSNGKITSGARKKGAKKRYRIIDFKRDKHDILGTVKSFEYDPNRTVYLACVLYTDGEWRYILATSDMKANDKVVSGEKAPIKSGNSIPLKKIPVGTPVHNIEIYPKAGGKMIRSAGTAGFITAKEGKYVNVKMPSGEVRRFLANCYATIGRLSNEELKLINWGKAGRSFHLGIRPHIRAKARPDGHPLAGSYKRRLGKHPVDKWGNLAKGGKTRSRSHTNKYIVTKRK